MKSFVILGSITVSYNARDILNKKGIDALVKRQPNNANRLGCGYGVLTTKEGVSIIQKSGIKILGIQEI